MQRQASFSQVAYAGKEKQTRRDKFLTEMEQAVPWPRLVVRLAPLYPKGERGRPPIGLERMLRVYFVQQWYGLSDGGVEDALYPGFSRWIWPAGPKAAATLAKLPILLSPVGSVMTRLPDPA